MNTRRSRIMHVFKRVFAAYGNCLFNRRWTPACAPAAWKLWRAGRSMARQAGGKRMEDRGRGRVRCIPAASAMGYGSARGSGLRQEAPAVASLWRGKSARQVEYSPKNSRIEPLNPPMPHDLPNMNAARLLSPLRSHSDGRGEGQGEVRALCFHWMFGVRCSMFSGSRDRFAFPRSRARQNSAFFLLPSAFRGWGPAFAKATARQGGCIYPPGAVPPCQANKDGPFLIFEPYQSRTKAVPSRTRSAAHNS